jgi:dTMP kinase
VKSVVGGFLLTFEGIGGSGKSTLAKLLREHLAAEGWDVRASREPGATPLGGSLRTLLLARDGMLAPWTEAFLFEADRAQTYHEVLRPALDEGAVIVSDRGPFGTIAYQAHGRGLELPLIDDMSRAAWDGTEPDLIFVVDVDAPLGLSRKAGSAEGDRFDDEDLAFTSRVRDGYLFAASRFGPRAVVVDGTSPLPELFEQVRQVTVARLQTVLRESGGGQ